MATHSSILAWRILWTEEPGRLQFGGLQSQTQRKQLIKGFLGGTGGKELPASAGDVKRHKLDP